MKENSLSHTRQFAFVVVTMGVMLVFDVLLLLVAILTLFQARRFYAEVMVRGLSRLILAMARIRIEVHGRPTSAKAVFYMPNHPSMLDVFILTAMGLPRTRYFMSTSVWTYFPFAFASWLMGVFFTPSQSRSAARVRCFQRAERHLMASGESVLGTPEGQINRDGLGPFNRGVFHLAAQLQIPIVPISILFPPEANPGLFARHSTVVSVSFLPEIETDAWRVDDINSHKEQVREVFQRFITEHSVTGHSASSVATTHKKTS
jgi:putative phosphoserine phosphatase/1-acylglycerol-3-phosphate O-acyltransferase